jgi:hypothetical protein
MVFCSDIPQRADVFQVTGFAVGLLFCEAEVVKCQLVGDGFDGIVVLPVADVADGISHADDAANFGDIVHVHRFLVMGIQLTKREPNHILVIQNVDPCVETKTARG